MTRDERRDFERELADALDVDLRRYDAWCDDELHPAELDDPSEWPDRWRAAGAGIVHGMCPACYGTAPYRQRADGITAVPHRCAWGLCRGMRLRGLTIGGPPLRASIASRLS